MALENCRHTHKHTHTQSEYCNPRVHARRPLTTNKVHKNSTSIKHAIPQFLWGWGVGGIPGPPLTLIPISMQSPKLWCPK